MVVDEFSQERVYHIQLRTFAAVTQLNLYGHIAQRLVLHVILGSEEIIAFAYGAQREFQVKKVLQRYHSVAHAQMCQYRRQVYEVLLRKLAFHEYNLAHLFGELQLVLHLLEVGGESHLLGHAGGEVVSALLHHHLPYAVETQFLFYIVHLVKVKIEWPMLAEGL